ncbi:hypothetical protein DEO72_LG9g2915 [Vigna unguiculata]|uniref:Uncharacterized protein n=1 Tax=Vigna unguiculata TaxID=3917 RepID=A0A4D6N254_VIGUN|nr:hypothetical protein DEO72_LG9g2915 [Vigna unguiculata]
MVRVELKIANGGVLRGSRMLMGVAFGVVVVSWLGQGGIDDGFSLSIGELLVTMMWKLPTTSLSLMCKVVRVDDGGMIVTVKEFVHITIYHSSLSRSVGDVSNVCSRACETFGEGMICWL